MIKRYWTRGRVTVFVLVWLTLVMAAFYGYFWRYIQPFDHQQLYLEHQVNNPLIAAFVQQYGNIEPADEAQIFVYHWLDPQCFCTVYSGGTLAKLGRLQSLVKVQHIIFTPPQKRQQLHRLLPDLPNSTVIALSETAYGASKAFIPATPAVLIFNRQTEMVSYLGPHSSGVVCGSGKSFVELVLNNLSHGFDPALYELEQTGCFCDW